MILKKWFEKQALKKINIISEKYRKIEKIIIYSYHEN